jgi:hypothetical protein
MMAQWTRGAPIVPNLIPTAVQPKTTKLDRAKTCRSEHKGGLEAAGQKFSRNNEIFPRGAQKRSIA